MSAYRNLKQSRLTFRRSQYRLLGLVGRGQYGKVFLGVHRATGSLFALKELDQDRFPTNQFLRELRFLVTLQHPNIVTCWACDYWMNHRYLVTDYCAGGTLRQLMESRASLSLGQTDYSPHHLLTALSLIEGILSGLAHAHDKNIIHCDIKPENILLDVRSQSMVPRIADFGIARLVQDLTQSAKTFGTGMSGSPAYMAPERFYGQHSVSADLYATGVLMYELIMGNRPFSGTPGALMQAHLNNIVWLPESLPESLKVILLRSLAKVPGQRYRNATEMRKAVMDAAEEIKKHTTGHDVILITIPGTLPILRLKCSRNESIPRPLQQLLVQQRSNGDCHPIDTILYRVESTKVHFYRLNSPDIDSGPLKSHRFLDDIHQAWGSAMGCYIATISHLYYCDEEWLRPCLPACLTEAINGDFMSIDPMGHWFVQLSSIAESQIESQIESNSEFQLQLFFPEQRQPRWTRSLTLPVGQKIQQIQAIDSRHFVVISQADSQDKFLKASASLRLEIWNRRGDRLGHMSLQVSVQRFWPTSRPRHLIATEQHSPQSLLFISLQPLQVRRVELPFEPKVIAVMERGYLVIDQLGKGILLTNDGEAIAHVTLPENPTAVVVIDNRILLISTWSKGIGHLMEFNIEPLQDLL
ncbi:MAG: serine/threonine protein kinase [Alkalinema sp. CAN_BIN05]|nr:serine/threonine protein kinase [Alkalinema sp. CAN_BIN05]